MTRKSRAGPRLARSHGSAILAKQCSPRSPAPVRSTTNWQRIGWPSQKEVRQQFETEFAKVKASNLCRQMDLDVAYSRGRRTKVFVGQEGEHVPLNVHKTRGYTEDQQHEIERNAVKRWGTTIEYNTYSLKIVGSGNEDCDTTYHNAKRRRQQSVSGEFGSNQ